MCRVKTAANPEESTTQVASHLRANLQESAVQEQMRHWILLQPPTMVSHMWVRGQSIGGADTKVFGIMLSFANPYGCMVNLHMLIVFDRDSVAE